MANKHPKEEALYQQIKFESIKIDHFVWDTLYFYMGDYISAVNVMSSYYIELNEPMPVSESKKILQYTQLMKKVIDQLVHPQKIEETKGPLGRLKESYSGMHAVVRELVTHYLCNDIMAINFIVSYHLDPAGPESIPVEDIHKIHHYSTSMVHFLDKLRRATTDFTGF